MIQNISIFSNRNRGQPVLKLSTFTPKFNDNNDMIVNNEDDR